MERCLLGLYSVRGCQTVLCVFQKRRRNIESRLLQHNNLGFTTGSVFPLHFGNELSEQDQLSWNARILLLLWWRDVLAMYHL
jgi:hypothetical protein